MWIASVTVDGLENLKAKSFVFQTISVVSKWFFSIFLVLLVANLCFAWRSQGCKRCSHRKLKCYKTSLQVVVQPLNYNFPPLKQHIRCTSSSGSGGGGWAPLPLIFEAPDYILRPKLCIFRADQSWPPPPWPNPGSVIDLIWQS